MIRSFNVVHEDDTTAVLKLGARVIDASGVADELQRELDQKKQRNRELFGGGRPPIWVALTVRAFLICMFHLVYSGKDVTYPRLMHHLLYSYTDEQMNILDLGEYRNATRSHRVLTNSATQHAEHERLRAWAVEALAPIDDTPLPVNKRVSNRTLAAAYKAGGEPLKAKRVRLGHSTNRLVASSIYETSLDEYRDHLAIDEHQSALAAMNERIDPTQKVLPDEPLAKQALQEDIFRGLHPNGPEEPPLNDADSEQLDGLLHAANAMAGVSVHLRRIKAGSAVGLTCAVAVAKPGDPPVVPIVLGIGFAQPSAASVAAGLEALDAAVGNDLVSPARGNKHRYVVTDMAYNHRDGWNEGLLQRGFYQVVRYPKNYITVHDLWRPHDTDGPRLVSGNLTCPALPGDVARTINLRPLPDRAKPDQIRKRERDLEIVQGAIMPTQGSPWPSTGKPQGRPPGRNTRRTESARVQAAITAEQAAPNSGDSGTFKVKTVCPARADQIRCALYPPSMKLDAAVTPTGAPPKKLADCCRGTYTTVTMTATQFKQWQRLLAGSWEHDDFYRHARAHNEAFFSHLVRRNGGNLNDRTIVFKRNALTALVLTMAVVATNLKLQAAWQQRIIRNDGHVPTPARQTKIRDRRRLLHQDATDPEPGSR